MFDLMNFVDGVGTEDKLQDVGGSEDSKHVVVDIQDFLDMTMASDMHNNVLISHDHQSPRDQNFVQEQATAASALQPASASAAASALQPASASATATATAAPTIDNNNKHADWQRGPPDAQEVVLPGERQGTRMDLDVGKPGAPLKLKTEFVGVDTDLFIKAGTDAVADPCCVFVSAFAFDVDSSTLQTTREP